MYRKLSRVALVLALVAAACGDDGPSEPSPAALTSDEAEELAFSLLQAGLPALLLEVQQLFQSLSTQSVDAGGLQPLAGEEVPFTHELSATANCTAGGTVALEGTINGTHYPDESRVVAHLEGTQTYNQCKLPLRQSQGTIEITSTPTIDWEADLEAVRGNLVGDATFRLQGDFDWKRSGTRSVRCSLALSGKVSAGQQTIELSGTFCGVQVANTVALDD
jgi:hypothetical protein